ARSPLELSERGPLSSCLRPAADSTPEKSPCIGMKKTQPAHRDGRRIRATLTEFVYLRAEWHRLSVEYARLWREFSALQDGPCDRQAHVLCYRRSREFRASLANHRIALEWARHPPCGTPNSHSPEFYSAPAVRLPLLDE